MTHYIHHQSLVLSPQSLAAALYTLSPIPYSLYPKATEGSI